MAATTIAFAPLDAHPPLDIAVTLSAAHAPALPGTAIKPAVQPACPRPESVQLEQQFAALRGQSQRPARNHDTADNADHRVKVGEAAAEPPTHDQRQDDEDRDERVGEYV